jgi:hypothetical protein
MPIPQFAKVKLLIPVAAAGLVIAGCGSGSSNSPASSSPASTAATNVKTTEAQAAATGDIPDNQRFLRYKKANAPFSILYPEGWAQKGSPTDLTFSDKANQVHVAIASGSQPSPAQAKAALVKSVPPADGLKVTKVEQTTAGSNPVIHITYEKTGPADPVTGKKLTLMVDRYVLAKGGKVATVDELTPVGVDNVDAYRMIIESFRWA